MNGTSAIDGEVVGKRGPSWHVVGVGNYDNQGRPDILLQHTDGQAAIWLMSGAATPTLQIALEPNPGATWHLQAG
jgi:hypothetical protein